MATFFIGTLVLFKRNLPAAVIIYGVFVDVFQDVFTGEVYYNFDEEDCF